jgi:hypothetical protein
MMTTLSVFNKSGLISNFKSLLAAYGAGAGLFFGATNLSVGQSLVQNAGYETGDISFWSLENDSYGLVDHLGYTSGISPHSGDYLLILGASGTIGTLSQTLSTVANQEYLISLWFYSPAGNTTNEFSVLWNGTTLFEQANIAPAGWTNMQFIVTATSSSSVLQFRETVDPGYLGLDDVNVYPNNNLSFLSMAPTNGNAMVFSWNSQAGISYEVQYSTGLTQTNWVILSTNTATGSVLTYTDFYGTDPHRFYRIRRLP